ncbi:MAG: KH domain-containing protein [Planctomycetaceae bacterium]
MIGPGGKNIRQLQEDTNTQIDIAEDGTVTIASPRVPGPMPPRHASKR